jgi:DNA-binding MarR family transcriptional regulator
LSSRRHLRDPYPESAIRDTVERTGLAQSRVSTSVANLRRRGWVETGPDSDDGCKTLAAVTEQMARLAERSRMTPEESLV